MPGQPLRPGDLPPPVTRKERRGWASADRDDEVRAYTGGRPNEAPRHGRFDDCAMSKFSQHRFVAQGGRCCEFCGRAWRDCLRRPTPRKVDTP